MKFSLFQKGKRNTLKLGGKGREYGNDISFPCLHVQTNILLRGTHSAWYQQASTYPEMPGLSQILHRTHGECLLIHRADREVGVT